MAGKKPIQVEAKSGDKFALVPAEDCGADFVAIEKTKKTGKVKRLVVHRDDVPAIVEALTS